MRNGLMVSIFVSVRNYMPRQAAFPVCRWVERIEINCATVGLAVKEYPAICSRVSRFSCQARRTTVRIFRSTAPAVV